MLVVKPKGQMLVAKLKGQLEMLTLNFHPKYRIFGTAYGKIVKQAIFALLFYAAVLQKERMVAGLETSSI